MGTVDILNKKPNEPAFPNGIENKFVGLKTVRLQVAIIVLFAAVLYFSNLGKTPIYILDEAKNAQCAREMLTSGDWVTPTFNGELRTDKPPFHYFFMMLSYSLFGVNEFSARFFSGIFGIATLLSTYFFSRRFLGAGKAFFITLTLLCSLHFTFEMRLSVPDPYLIFLLSTCLFSFFTFLQTNQKKYLWASYALMGLGILCKGPLAIVVPAVILFGYLLVEKKFSFKTIWSLQPLVGIIFVALFCMPWYYAVHKATAGAWTQGFLFDHNLRRFSEIKEGHGGFFLLTAVFMFIGMLPFSAFIVPTVRHVKQLWCQQPLIRYCSLVTIVFLLFFTISRTQLPNYAMPAYPFLAVLLGSFLYDWVDKSVDSSLKISLICYFFLMATIPVAVYFAVQNEPSIRYLNHLYKYFLLLPLGAIVSGYLYLKGARQLMLGCMGGSFILVAFLFFWKIYPAVYNENPVRKSIAVIDQSKPLIAYRDYNPGYNFYLNKPIKLFNDTIELRKFIELHPDYILISRENLLPELKSVNERVVFRGKDIFEIPVTIIMKPKL